MTAAEALEVVVERVVRTFKPVAIVLFGSHAYGSPGPDSDLDLLIVLARVHDRASLVADIYNTLRGIPFPKDILLTDTERIRKGEMSIFEREAWFRGNKVYESGQRVA